MKRIALAVLAALALIICSLPSATLARTVLDSYCSPTGDYCTGAFREQGRIKLSISTFSFTGEYQLCIDPPTGRDIRDCKSFELRTKPNGVYSSRIDFARNFSGWGRGRYGVSWLLMGSRLGPLLRFNVP